MFSKLKAGDKVIQRYVYYPVNTPDIHPTFGYKIVVIDFVALSYLEYRTSTFRVKGFTYSAKTGGITSNHSSHFKILPITDENLALVKQTKDRMLLDLISS